METPIPFTQALENQYLPKIRINEKLKELMAY
jgi:2-oxoisovalerate dehydrogenase E1 component